MDYSLKPDGRKKIFDEDIRNIGARRPLEAKREYRCVKDRKTQKRACLGAEGEEWLRSHSPSFSCTPKDLSANEHDREFLPHGQDGHDHAVRDLQYVRDRAHGVAPYDCVRGYVRGDAHVCECGYAHVCALCLRENVRDCAGERVHGYVSACVHVFLPSSNLLSQDVKALKAFHDEGINPNTRFFKY